MRSGRRTFVAGSSGKSSSYCRRIALFSPAVRRCSCHGLPRTLTATSNRYDPRTSFFCIPLLLHGGRQRQFVDFQTPVRAHVAEQKPDEVLVSLLAIDDPEVARVAAVHERVG